jgi:hypothetical protein
MGTFCTEIILVAFSTPSQGEKETQKTPKSTTKTCERYSKKCSNPN